MIDNTGMYQTYSVEGELKVKNDNKYNCNMLDVDMNCAMPDMCPPIYECPRERCIHREIVHNVSQE